MIDQKEIFEESIDNAIHLCYTIFAYSYRQERTDNYEKKKRQKRQGITKRRDYSQG